MRLPSLATDEARRRLLSIIRDVSLFRGHFVLASGATSNVYFDLRRTTTHPEGATLAARLLLQRFEPHRPDAIGGPTLGADAIVGAVTALSHLDGCPLPGFIVRKVAKDHGAGKRVEGHLEPGWRVVVVDDTVTGGGSIVEAADVVRAAGATPIGLFTLVDRNEGGRERAAEAGLTLDALFTADEVLGDG